MAANFIISAQLRLYTQYGYTHCALYITPYAFIWCIHALWYTLWHIVHSAKAHNAQYVCACVKTVRKLGLVGVEPTALPL